MSKMQTFTHLYQFYQNIWSQFVVFPIKYIVNQEASTLDKVSAAVQWVTAFAPQAEGLGVRISASVTDLSR